MKTLNKNNSLTLRSVSLLFLLLVTVIVSLPSDLTAVCLEVCNSDVVWEDHSLQPGMDTLDLPDLIADFCICNKYVCKGGQIYFSDYSIGVIKSWEWDFGDPTSGSANQSSLENPTHYYTNPGTYTVTLTVIGYGNSSTVVKQNVIVVEALPIADFIVTPDSGCVGTLFQFEDRSIGATSWEWDFGDGSVSYEQNPTHSYSAPGVYSVRLWAKNECGWHKKIKDVIVTVGKQPFADFTYEADQSCEGSMVRFFDQSTDADTWHWDFGDGASSTDQNPTHTYAAGTYDVTLTVSNDCGTDDTTQTIEITLSGPPTADFSYENTPSCYGGSVTFTDLSTDAYSWRWDFGDGGTATTKNPTHVYTTAGVYTVSLIAFNECGDDDISKEVVITIIQSPTADFSSILDGNCVGATATFTNLSTNASTYLWNFGDGTTSTDENPTHTYNAPGIFTVALTAFNDCGDDTKTKEALIVIGGPPVADFRASEQPYCVALPVQFTDLSVDAMTWTWDFGDGNTSTVQHPTHTYAAVGTYTVTLRITNDCGDDSMVKEQYLNIIDGPTADFTSNLIESCVGGYVEFTDLSVGADSWSWTFGDGTNSSDQNPTHSYTAPGSYSITLSISGPCGEDDITKTEYIMVYPGPHADFESNNPVTCDNDPVEFINLSTNANTWYWEFGDGVTSTEENPSHTYPGPGRYTVSLTVTNECGGDDEIKAEYIWIGQGPIADFDTHNYEGCIGMPFDFHDLSTNADSWFWEFGDGEISHLQNPTHTYRTDGLFTVTLTVSNECGDDIERRQNYILIHPLPVAEFSSDQYDVCVGATISFTDLSTGDPYQWDWDFGDGGGSSDQNPSHQYTVAGTYDVTLTVGNGCGDDPETKQAYIVVHPEPVAHFEADNPQACVGVPVTFHNNSSNADDYYWTFGDGDDAYDLNPSHTYQASGVYTVSMWAYNECGYDSLIKVAYITVGEGPIADFDRELKTICLGESVDFIDLSTGATSWNWRFGDGTESSDQNPSHTYTQAGLYNVFLTVRNSCGSDGTEYAGIVVVLPKPVADFKYEKSVHCNSTDVYFENLSADADSYLWNFGDGTTSTIENPNHNYNVAGNYDVKLVATNDCGTDSVTKQLTIYIQPDPIAAFITNKTDVCPLEVVHFNNQSTNANNFYWDFGDSTDSYDASPNHAYAQPGTYTVTLVAEGICEKTDKEIKELYITVGEGPEARASADKFDICIGGTVNFSDLSLRAESWSWDFDDGSSSPIQHPSHTFTTAGLYEVRLTVRNECGTDYTLEPLFIHVRPKPTADFTYQALASCNPEIIDFTDASTHAIHWEWDFGDGTTSTDQNPRHLYTSSGSFTVNLKAYNLCGDDDISKKVLVDIVPDVVADFRANKTRICAGETVDFTDLTIGPVTNHYWDFGDNSPTSHLVNPSHTYNTPGTYTVTLNVEGFCYKSDYETKELYITVLDYPLAGYKADKYQTCVGGTVNFTDQSLRADSWNWHFGDGNSSFDQHPSHVYTTAGIYEVYLTVENECGPNSTYEPLRIFVSPPPTADFSYRVSGECGPKTVSFTNLSNVGDSWLWDFGDGTNSTQENPIHGYHIAGNYDVKLITTNACGSDSITKVVPIEILPPPIAKFTSNTTQICIGGTVQFTDQSTGALTWHWDFGDGTGSSSQHPSHTYTAPGTYTVTLDIVGSCGSDDISKEKYITVLPGPIAFFRAEPTEGCADLTVSFIDQSAGAASWSWNFGDGKSSSMENPTHTYSAPGTYTVKLTVTNICGSDDEERIEYITVSGPPIADFEYEQDAGCESGTVYILDRSTYATAWHWDFGDGTTSNIQQPDHDYSASGTYTITLIASNSCGTDTSSQDVTIELAPGPVADFFTEVNEVCMGEIVYFYDQSLRADTWAWDFGDGTSSQLQNPTHIYATAGVYTVSLKVTNECGDDTKTKINYVTVLAGPTAAFRATPTSGTPTLSVAFTDLSISTQGIHTWNWSFGDGGTATTQHPTHDYPTPGTYTVTLVVIDPCGADTAIKSEYIYVIDSCSIDISAEPTEGCAPLTVWFGGQEIGNCEITSWLWDFGDPASGVDNQADTKNTQHIYANSGAYTVTLKAVNDGDTLTVTKTNFITVYDGPTASFTATPTFGQAPLYVNFTDQSTSPNTITSWLWDFGDPNSGSLDNSTQQHPSHTYFNNGTYTVRLIVSDMCGVDTTTENVTVAAALELVKEVDKFQTSPGDELLYTLTLRNNGSEPYFGLIVRDTIPDLTSYIANSLTGGGTYLGFNDLVAWPVAQIDPGTEKVFTFKVLLDGPFNNLPEIVSNYGIAVYGAEFAKLASTTIISNVVETIVDIPLGPPTIDKDVNTALAIPGDILTYTITINNGEPTPASGLKVYDAPPDYTTFLGNITGGGTYDPVADSLFWDLGTLAAFSDISVSFDVTVDSTAPDGLLIPNSALFVTDYLGGDQSDTVITEIYTEPFLITKTASRPSGMIGDLIKFTIEIQNFSGDQFNNLTVLDTLPIGLTCVDGTSYLDGVSIADPGGTNPITWNLGMLPPNSTVTLVYTSLITPSATPGAHLNIARATAIQNGGLTNSNRAVAPIYILSYTISGSIRGQVIVDCDGDGVADIDSVPSGMDIYLDDGSHSRVNDKGMFYFSTVRPGERVVALDRRDLDNFFVPEGAQASVFVYVNEAGESYVIFRICPDYPKLNILKKASIIPTVKVIKTATINPDPITDSLGVLIDYQIDIKSNGLADPTQVRVVDSFPENMNVILSEGDELIPKHAGNELVYEITAAEEQLQKSVYYSLKDLTPGVRRFLTNKVHLEGDPTVSARAAGPMVSEPAEVAAGPFLLAPPQDVTITLTPALFITSKADLQGPAYPLLQEVADSIGKYPDASIWVEGHTDLRIINNEEFPSNWELGEARAKTVADWLIDSANIDGTRITYVSYAATRPVVSEVPLNSVALQPNRRTEVIIKAAILGFLAPEADPAKSWQSSTSMALNPNRFDTLFEAVENPIAIDLDDSWEVFLTVINESDIGATVSSLIDILPDGTEFIKGTATIDGEAISASISGNVISLELKQILPSQSLVLRYRIRTIDGQQPSGGGAASIEIKTASELPVVQSSNTIKFE